MKSFGANSQSSVNVDYLKQQLKSVGKQEQQALEETSVGLTQSVRETIQIELDSATQFIQQSQGQVTYNVEQFAQNKIDQIHIFSTIQVQELEQTVQNGQESIQSSLDQAYQVMNQLTLTVEEASNKQIQLEQLGAAQVASISQEAQAAANAIGQEVADSLSYLTQHKQNLEAELQIFKDSLAQQLQAQYDLYQFESGENSTGIMVGAIIYTSNASQFTQNTNKWLLCDGTQFDSVQYPILFEFLQTNTLPDLTNQFIRCQDNLRLPFQVQEDSTRQHEHAINLDTTVTGSHTHTIPSQSVTGFTETSGSHRHKQYYKNTSSGEGGLAEEANSGNLTNDDGFYWTEYEGDHIHGFTVNIASKTSFANGSHSHSVQGSTQATEGEETRPTNACLYAVIKVDNS